MFEYTHNNHFRFGYDGEWFNLPTAYSQELRVDYGTVTELMSTFEFECRKAVRHIYDAADGTTINLSFSGGVDSEIMVRMFEKEELPFDITILKFEHDLNLHDVSFAISYCESRGLKYDIKYLDVERFFRSREFMEIAERTHCISPQITTHIWLLQHMTGLPVFGCGEGGLVKAIPEDYIPGTSAYPSTKWTHPVSEKHLAMYRHCLQTGQKAVPGFFRYTPGQLYTFMNNPMVHELAADKVRGKLSTQTSKCSI